jgi:hypothetical protein
MARLSARCKPILYAPPERKRNFGDSHGPQNNAISSLEKFRKKRNVGIVAEIVGFTICIFSF